MKSLELVADATPFTSLLAELSAHLANAPLEVVNALSDLLVNGAGDAFRLECEPASGGTLKVLIHPSERLLELASAVRASQV